MRRCKGPPLAGGYAGAFGTGQGERGASSGPLALVNFYNWERLTDLLKAGNHTVGPL